HLADERDALTLLRVVDLQFRSYVLPYSTSQSLLDRIPAADAIACQPVAEPHSRVTIEIAPSPLRGLMSPAYAGVAASDSATPRTSAPASVWLRLRVVGAACLGWYFTSVLLPYPRARVASVLPR